jgi:hypothetical protein
MKTSDLDDVTVLVQKMLQRPVSVPNVPSYDLYSKGYYQALEDVLYEVEKLDSPACATCKSAPCKCIDLLFPESEAAR